MLKQLEQTPPQIPPWGNFPEGVPYMESDYRAVLEDNNIPNTTAFRWQQLATVSRIFIRHSDNYN